MKFWRSAVKLVPFGKDPIAQAEQDLWIPQSALGRGMARWAFRWGTKSASSAGRVVSPRSVALTVRLLNGLEVLDQWERVVEMVEECAPLLVLLGSSETDRVVI